MSLKNIPLPGKTILFLAPLILITLTVSFPLFSFLLFAAFPAVFELIRGEKTTPKYLCCLP
jgi:hypothetical protein